MALTEEERRAALYREQAVRRAEHDRQRKAGLAGNVQARVELDSRWRPLKDWLDAEDPHGEGLLR